MLRRAAGVSLVAAGLVYLTAEAVTARGWATPRYSYVHNYVSDLGAPICAAWNGRPVCSPLHSIMNMGFVLDGVFFLLGAILAVGLAGRSGTRPFVVLAFAHTLGLALVAGVPGTTPEPAGHLHALGAVLAIVGGNLAVILGGRAVSGSGTPRWLPVASAALGTFGIAAFALLIGLPVLAPGLLAVLGEGLVERLSIYTITGWEILAGTLLMAASPLVGKEPGGGASPAGPEDQMTRARMGGVPLPLLVAGLAAWTVPAAAQNAGYSNPNMMPTNDLPNPYSAKQVMPLPDAREWGSTAGVDGANGGDDIWAIDRCGDNTCVGSQADPLLHYDANGNLIGRMGAELFAFPHGIHVDQEGNVWVTDPLPPDGRGAGGDVGQQVTKLSPDGEILLQLGTRTVTGTGPNEFSSPSDVVVGTNGNIFVADGHGEGTAERIMKFDRNGNFIMQWGRPGNGPCGAGEFSSLHALDIDSQGRLFIGDRDNNRIQIYDQDGNYLDCWYQFSRPSGIYIDADDNMFVTDSESRDGADNGLDRSHPGWQRGIRIGSARDGSVRYFIPDPDPQGGSSTSEGVAAIRGGAVVYGAEVGPRLFVRYIRN